MRNSGVVARKTLTPTLSHGEREKERRQIAQGRSLRNPSLGARKTSYPNPLPWERLLRNSGVVARKTLTTTLSHGEREKERTQIAQ